MTERPTVDRQPPIDPSKSSIENLLELVDLSIIAPDLFTNTRPLWHPPGARGIYGGAVIAQSLAAAQRTVAANYIVHSMHCYFVLAGDSEIPVMYYVERVRDGKSYATRTVQARQRGKCIFTNTMSFMRENSGDTMTLRHATPLPDGVGPPEQFPEQDPIHPSASPFLTHQDPILNRGSKLPHEKKVRQWMRATGRISEAGGYQAHLSALAYMSDSGFIGTIGKIHDLPPFADPAKEGNLQVGMMVSLDHTIYFHEPRKFRADEWMFTEMSSPWSGDGRGVVSQHMFAADGTLVATCYQEGVVRLKKPKASRL